MFCLIVTANWSYSSNITNHTLDGDGVSIIVITHIPHNGFDRSNSIDTSIEGHLLTVAFSENLGQVAVEITDASGATVHYLSVLTPNGLQCYIPNTGDYVVTFTLPNGDVYYGEFTVTD